jgi:hypothetical protein
MSSRPLPGASYHTLETILHSFANVDLEAVGSLETLESPSEKRPLSSSSDESTPLLENSRARNRHGLPMLLALLLFFCLAFTASALLGYSASRWLMPDVPDRHVSIADHLSSAFQAQSQKTLVNEYYNGALEMMCVRVSHVFFPFPACLDSHGNPLGTRNSIVYVMINVRNSMCGTICFGLSLFCACAINRTFTRGLATRTKRPSFISGTLLSTVQMWPSLRLSCTGRGQTVA